MNNQSRLLFQKAASMSTIPVVMMGCGGLITSTGRQTSAKTTQSTSKHVSHLLSRNVHTFANYLQNSRQQVKSAHLSSIRRQYCLNSQSTIRNVSNAAMGATSKIPKGTSGFSSSGSSGSSGTSKSFLQWYEGHLQTKPVQTKMVTGSILWGMGDAVAQVVPPLFSNNEDNENGKDDINHNNHNAKEHQSIMQMYDLERTARAMFFGFTIHAPLSHVHFNFLEWMTVKGGFKGFSIPVFKAFMEQVRFKQ
jgi:hypothetical protein